MDLTTVTLREKSSAAPALTSWQGRLYVAWTGTDTRLNVMSTPDGRSFSDKIRLDEKSYRTESSSSMGPGGSSTTDYICLSPALAGSASGVNLAWTGSDGHLNVQLARSAGSPAHLRLLETSRVAPSLAALGGGIALAWTGSDRHVNLLVSRGGSFSGAVRLDETSTHSPAVCTHLGRLFLAGTGSDGRLNLARLGQAR